MLLLKPDTQVWKHLIILSLVSLTGMVILISIIFWQMFNNITAERQYTIRAQVESATSLTESIYREYVKGSISEVEAKAKVLAALSAMKYPDSGYFWVLDTQGVMLMHPFNRELVGQNLEGLQDAGGKYFVRKHITAARAGGGFISYEWTRPTTSEPETKIAYIAPFKPWNWMIGSGNYVKDLHQAAWQQIAYGGIVILVLFGINIATSLLLSRRYMNEYRDTAIYDALTGLHTRRYLDEIGTRVLSRQLTQGEADLAVIFFDVDHFKQINDNYGHKIGDRVLRQTGRIIRSNLRPNEMPFRYGGEEFVLLVYASEETCRIIAERLRKAISHHTFKFARHEINATISIGAAVHRDGETLSELLRRADRCMYAAKQNGRNCTVTESQILAGDDTAITMPPA